MPKNILLIFFIICCACSKAQIKMPTASPAQTIKQEFGLGFIELNYNRPIAKGRRIYGDLVPYNKIWRTGANAATKIYFSDPVQLNGKKIDSGSYVIYTIPNIDSWEIIMNKGLKNWGTDGYKETEDVVSFKVEPIKTKTNFEIFTMEFTDLKAESCQLQIKWAKTIIAINITTEIKDRLKTQVDAAMATDKKPYWQAAQYYKEYENNFSKALENCNKALEQNPKAYYIWLYKATLQKEIGDKAGAKISAKKSLELSKEIKNIDYIKMNETLLRKLK